MADSVPLMRTFLAVAGAASFSGAAKTLGLSRAAVSSQIAQLEARLGVRLFRRTTRTVALTDEGTQYASRVGALLEQIDALDNEYATRAGDVTGPLTVEVPEFFGVRVLAARVPQFLERYPAVSLNLVLNEKVDDVAHADADILVRSSLPQAHHLKYRRLGGFRLIAAASPRYLAKQGEPRHPRELGQHTTIDYINSVSGQPFEWEFDPYVAVAANPWSWHRRGGSRATTPMRASRLPSPASASSPTSTSCSPRCSSASCWCRC